MLSRGEVSLQKKLTSALECGVFAIETYGFFFTKTIEFVIFLREISAANFILEGRRSRNFCMFH